MGVSGKEVDEFCFKAENISIQRRVKLHGSKGKDSAMKEMKNLTIKNSCFGEIECAAITQGMKYRALPLLMFMALKRNGHLKTRGLPMEVNSVYALIKMTVVLQTWISMHSNTCAE